MAVLQGTYPDGGYPDYNDTPGVAYGMLFGNSEVEAMSLSYWLASKFESGYRYRHVLGMEEGDGEDNCGKITYEYGLNTLGVRVVVSLKSDITPTLKSTDSTTEISTYEI